jgi:hypothetical protein
MMPGEPLPVTKIILVNSKSHFEFTRKKELNAIQKEGWFNAGCYKACSKNK